MWAIQTQSVNGEELSTIETLTSKLAFNIQTPLPDSRFAGIARVKPFWPFSLFFSLGSILRPGSQRSAIVVQPNNANNSSYRQASQKSDTPIYTKVDEQRSREQDGASRESRSSKVVRCEQTRGVLRIR